MNVFFERLENLREAMAGSDLDAFLVSIPENRYFVSGFEAEDPMIMEISGFILVGRRDALVLTDGRYHTQALRECPGFRVMVYSADMMPVFQEGVTMLNAKRLGIESRHLSVRFYDRLTEALAEKGVEVVKTDGLVEPIREVKTEGELDRIVGALRVTESAFREVVGTLKPGMTEMETALNIERAMRDLGAQGPAFESIVASGPNAALPHAVPTDRAIREGEPVIFDIGAKKDKYCSDMSRTICLGGTDGKFREVYGLVREAQLSAIRNMKAGMTTDEVDALARRVIEEGGYGDYFLHSLGHGVGLAVHEAPSLRRVQPVELKAGMVVTVEPGIYLAEWGGVRLEEMVVIRENGAELLNRDDTFYDFR